MARQVRLHDQLLRERLSRQRVAFVCGPSQVGKTAACGALSAKLLDWNNISDRLVILRGAQAVARHLGLAQRREDVTVVIDNLHGHRLWKSFVRKLLACCGSRLRLAITTVHAARVPGRFPPANAFLLRLHPWSVAECARTGPVDAVIQPPAPVSDEAWTALLDHGGFPEPFRRRETPFTLRWHARQREQLIERDLPMLAAVRDPAPMQMLAVLLSGRSAAPLIYSELSRELGVAVDTIRRWIDLLAGLQYGFLVRPWHARVPKALTRQPKWFLRDWSAVADPAARARTFIACHLLKAAEGWADRGYGQFEVRYVGDKLKREVDFLMVRDRKPWFLVELSNSGAGGGIPSAALGHFQRCTRARHAFHVMPEAPYSPADCFEQCEPAAVPARTLLSQLL